MKKMKNEEEKVPPFRGKIGKSKPALAYKLKNGQTLKFATAEFPKTNVQLNLFEL